MKNLNVLLLLLLLSACGNESIEETHHGASSLVLFSAHANSEPTTKVNNQPKDIVSDTTFFPDGLQICVSVEEGEEWGDEIKELPASKVSWPEQSNAGTWLSGDAVGIFMRRTDGVADASVDRSNIKYTVAANGATATLSTANTPLRFPANKPVDFMAYYPHESFSGGSSLVNFTTQADTTNTLLKYTIPTNQTGAAIQNADLMVATKVVNRTNTNPNIALAFSHALTLMTFDIISTDFEAYQLSQATLSGTLVANTGTMDISTKTLAASASSTFSPYTVINKIINGTNAIYSDLIINPCRVTQSGQMKLSLAIGNKNYVCDMPNRNYVEGRRYHVRVTINNTQGNIRRLFVYGNGTVTLGNYVLGDGQIGGFDSQTAFSPTISANTGWVPFALLVMSGTTTMLPTTSPQTVTVPIGSTDVVMQFRPQSWYPTDGLLVHYDGLFSLGFNRTNTNSNLYNKWIDLGGSWISGVLFNVNYNTTTSGWGTNFLRLDGADDYVQFNAPASTDFSTNFLLKLAAEPQSNNAQISSRSSGTIGFYLSGNSNDNNRKIAVNATNYNGIIQTAAEGYAPVRGQIIQLTMTYSSSASTLKLYVNGVLTAQRSGVTMLPVAASARLGASMDGINPIKADYFSYMLYNRILSDAEITSIYTFNKSRFGF